MKYSNTRSLQLQKLSYDSIKKNPTPSNVMQGLHRSDEKENVGNTQGDNKQLGKKTCSHSTSRGTHAIADGGQILSFGYPCDPLTSRAPVFLTVHVVVVQAVTACRWEEQVGAESIALGARRHKVLPGRTERWLKIRPS